MAAMPKPAPLATFLAAAAAVVALAEPSSANAGLGDRLRALRERRATATAPPTAARGQDVNRTAEKGHGRAGGDAASDWDTIYSAGAGELPAQAAAPAVAKPAGPAPSARDVRVGVHRRRAR